MTGYDVGLNTWFSVHSYFYLSLIPLRLIVQVYLLLNGLPIFCVFFNFVPSIILSFFLFQFVCTFRSFSLLTFLHAFFFCCFLSCSIAHSIKLSFFDLFLSICPFRSLLLYTLILSFLPLCIKFRSFHYTVILSVLSLLLFFFSSLYFYILFIFCFSIFLSISLSFRSFLLLYSNSVFLVYFPLMINFPRFHLSCASLHDAMVEHPVSYGFLK